MLKSFTAALCGAFALFAGAATPAGAATLFFNNFTTGTGPNEEVIGNFSVADGYLGHHGGYANDEYSSYRIVLDDLSGFTNAFLDFDLLIDSEAPFDDLQVFADDKLLQGYGGYGGGHQRLALDYLTQPFQIGRQVISFDFSSDGSVTRGGVHLDNVVVSGDLNAPAGAVPELATWAMMVAGAGAVGGALRGRRRAAGGLAQAAVAA